MYEYVEEPTYDDLEKLLGIEKLNIVDKPNVISTNIFIPEYLQFNHKTTIYMTGLFKLVETFKERKPDDSWKLRIYVDKMILSNLSNLFRQHRIKFKTKYRSNLKKYKNNSINNNTKKTKYNNEKNFLNITKKINGLNNSNKSIIKFASGFEKYKKILKIYQDYIKYILDNKKLYPDIEIFTYNCKLLNYKINKENSKNYILGHPDTFGTIIRTLPMFESGVECIFQINISHALSPFLSNLIYKWCINKDSYIFNKSNKPNAYPYIFLYGYYTAVSDYFKYLIYDNNIINLTTESNITNLNYFKNNYSVKYLLENYRDDINLFNINKLTKLTKLTKLRNSNSFEDIEDIKFLNESLYNVINNRQFAGLYGCKTVISKNNLKYFYNMIYESIMIYNKGKTNIYNYGVDEFFLTIINYLNVLSNIKHNLEKNDLLKYLDFNLNSNFKLEIQNNIKKKEILMNIKKYFTDTKKINNVYSIMIAPSHHSYFNITKEKKYVNLKKKNENYDEIKKKFDLLTNVITNMVPNMNNDEFNSKNVKELNDFDSDFNSNFKLNILELYYLKNIIITHRKLIDTLMKNLNIKYYYNDSNTNSNSNNNSNNNSNTKLEIKKNITNIPNIYKVKKELLDIIIKVITKISIIIIEIFINKEQCKLTLNYDLNNTSIEYYINIIKEIYKFFIIMFSSKLFNHENKSYHRFSNIHLPILFLYNIDNKFSLEEIKYIKKQKNKIKIENYNQFLNEVYNKNILLKQGRINSNIFYYNLTHFLDSFDEKYPLYIYIKEDDIYSFEENPVQYISLDKENLFMYLIDYYSNKNNTLIEYNTFKIK